jgi:hypothetical protein
VFIAAKSIAADSITANEIASNYIYDLQQYNNGRKDLLSKYQSDIIENNKCPALSGETITNFYTIGSPMALWTLRYKDFGQPVNMSYNNYYKMDSEWLNFYDKSDILAYPIKNLNDNYKDNGTQDILVKNPGFLTFWNPMAHIKYCYCKEVHVNIAKGLSNTWEKINEN